MKCWLGLECLQLDAGGGRGFVLGVVKDVCVCACVCCEWGMCLVWSRVVVWQKRLAVAKRREATKEGKKNLGKGFVGRETRVVE